MQRAKAYRHTRKKVMTILGKKIAVTIFTVFLITVSGCFCTTALAATTTTTTTSSQSSAEIAAQQAAQKAALEQQETDQANKTNSFQSTMSSVTSFCAYGFNKVKTILLGSDSFFPNGDGIISLISEALKPLAYCIAIMCILINLMNKTLYFELFTKKGAITIFGEMFIAKILIDLCDTILKCIININNSAVQYLFSSLGGASNISMPSYNITNTICNIPIIGAILTFLWTAAASIPLFIASFFMLGCCSIILIVLGCRMIKIVCMRCMANVFVATYASDETKDISKKFFRSFISTVIQTLFMSIAYILMANMINNALGSANILIIDSACLYTLVLTWAIVKTPAWLNEII
jgi:hypothetical protein